MHPTEERSNMYDDFNVFNGWVLLHHEECGEDTHAFRISDVQSCSFTDDNEFSYKLRTWDYACKVEFIRGGVCENRDHGSRDGAPLAWALWDEIITEGFKGSEA